MLTRSSRDELAARHWTLFHLILPRTEISVSGIVVQLIFACNINFTQNNNREKKTSLAGGKWIKWRIINEFSRAIKMFVHVNKQLLVGRRWRTWLGHREESAHAHLVSDSPWFYFCSAFLFRCFAKIFQISSIMRARASLTNKSRLNLRGKFTSARINQKIPSPFVWRLRSQHKSENDLMMRGLSLVLFIFTFEPVLSPLRRHSRKKRSLIRFFSNWILHSQRFSTAAFLSSLNHNWWNDFFCVWCFYFHAWQRQKKRSAHDLGLAHKLDSDPSCLAA